MSDETTVTSDDIVDAMVSSIGSANTAEYKSAGEVLKSKQPAAAPEAKQVEKPVAEESQTATESVEPSDNSVTKETEPQVEKPAEKKADDVATPEAEVDVDDLLGLKNDPVDYKEAYSASSREGKRLAEERKTLEAKLQELGLEIVNTEKGLDFTPTDKAFERASKEVDQKAIDSAWDKLPASKRELMDEASFKEAAKQVALNVQAKRPVVTAKTEERMLAANEVDTALNTLATEKMGNGTPRYPEIMSKDVQEIMVKVYQANEPLRKAMNQSPESFKALAPLVYAAAWRVVAPKKAALAMAQSAKQKAETEKQKGPSITSSTSASQSNKSLSAEDKVIQQIGSAKRS